MPPGVALQQSDGPFTATDRRVVLQRMGFSLSMGVGLTATVPRSENVADEAGRPNATSWRLLTRVDPLRTPALKRYCGFCLVELPTQLLF